MRFGRLAVVVAAAVAAPPAVAPPLALAADPPPALAADPPPAATLTLAVRATGFRNTNGQAVVALYRSSDDWLKVKRAFRVATLPIRDGAVDVRFEGLGAGVYAVAVVHDENRNGKLDMRWFPWPKPKEGGGVSNDARGGPPKWRDCKLELQRDATIQVSLTY